jgi:hypothetical protein
MSSGTELTSEQLNLSVDVNWPSQAQERRHGWWPQHGLLAVSAHFAAQRASQAKGKGQGDPQQGRGDDLGASRSAGSIGPSSRV